MVNFQQAVEKYVEKVSCLSRRRCKKQLRSFPRERKAFGAGSCRAVGLKAAELRAAGLKAAGLRAAGLKAHECAALAGGHFHGNRKSQGKD